MSMVAAPHGKWFARFRGDEEDEFEFEYQPVVAWGRYEEEKEYTAMVLDLETGDLLPANAAVSFSGLCDAEEVTLAEMTPEEIRVRNKRERERLERLR
ncbi:hypothetical protein ACFV10_10440 [Streptomyces cyaneofuscatus]|uniref:hypothetical protein n=1 Tax=Streptomyces cyaneofuscatus TaxID=66883 RepID=UPI0036A5EF54